MSPTKPLAVDTDTHSQIALLARAWGVSHDEVLRKLLAQFAQLPTAPPAVAGMDVYAIYACTRVEGRYDPVTGALTIEEGPGQGHYKTPSGASAAVLRALRPTVTPIRSGWEFWRIRSTGVPLESIRPDHTRRVTPATPPPATSVGRSSPARH
ncbi:hypothetical protein ACTPOK_09860 [Streptomyces inhibens]|uniref:hypothetical protein n=1 Tax=Streptomyces inhibens TaxID=2293571 RepID=UPI00402ACA42